MQPALQQVRCRDRVLLGTGRGGAGKSRREPLVVGLDVDVEPLPQMLDEAVGLAGLLAALAAERERHADDDGVRLVLGDEAGDRVEAGVVARPQDHLQRARDRARRVRDGDAGPRAAVVERQHAHAYSAARIRRSASASASGSLSASLPPARAIVGRPPPPPPTIGAAPRMTSDALTRSASRRRSSRRG